MKLQKLFALSLSFFCPLWILVTFHCLPCLDPTDNNWTVFPQIYLTSDRDAVWKQNKASFLNIQQKLSFSTPESWPRYHDTWHNENRSSYQYSGSLDMHKDHTLWNVMRGSSLQNLMEKEKLQVTYCNIPFWIVNKTITLTYKNN